MMLARRLPAALLAAAALCIPALAAAAPLAPAVDLTRLLFPLTDTVHLAATTAGEGDGQDFLYLRPGKTRTILTIKGPAVIQRIWSTSQFTGQTRLVAKVDGKTIVLWDKASLPREQALGDPLRAMDGQAYWSYVPITIKREAVFIATDQRRPQARAAVQPTTPTRPAMPYAPGNAATMGRPGAGPGSFPGNRMAPPGMPVQPGGAPGNYMMAAGGPPRPIGPGAAGAPRDVPDGNKFYLQVAYTPGLAEAVAPAEVARLRARLQTLSKIPGVDITSPRAGHKITGLTLAVGAVATVPGDDKTVITTLSIKPGDIPFSQLANTRLILRSDGAADPCVDVPLPFLFGAYWDFAQRPAPLLSAVGDRLVCNLPIPVGKGLTIALEPYQKGPCANSLSATIVTRQLPEPPPYRFFAEYRSTLSKAKEPIRMAEIAGQGTLIGCTFAGDALAHRKFAFLEGNEQITVDGAPKPNWEGTGTEDFFNAAWYFSAGVNRRPYHALTYMSEGPPPRMSSYRLLVPDPVTFRQGLRFDIQHGSRNSAPDILYKTVALWYQRPPGKVRPPAEAPMPSGEDAIDVPDEEAFPDVGPWPSTIATFLVLALIAFGIRNAIRRRH